MSNSSDGAAGGGIGFLGLLTIVFIVLKLMGYIAWSWWWVLSPLWIPWALIIGGGIFWFICYMIWGLTGGRGR